MNFIWLKKIISGGGGHLLLMIKDVIYADSISQYATVKLVANIMWYFQLLFH